MSDNVDILAMAEHEYAVTVREGATETHHRVTVPEDLVLDLGAPDLDEETLVRESFAFLLEREKPTEIGAEFSLDEIRQHFPDYADDLRARTA
jgi:hypothetical protein